MKTRLIPYIKPTRNKHDSGYNKFECGCLNADEGANPTHKYVVSRSSDHVQTNFNLPPVHMDLIDGGYIRIWSHGTDVKWLTEYDLFSDMELVAGAPSALIELEPIKEENRI